MADDSNNDTHITIPVVEYELLAKRYKSWVAQAGAIEERIATALERLAAASEQAQSEERKALTAHLEEAHNNVHLLLEQVTNLQKQLAANKEKHEAWMESEKAIGERNKAEADLMRQQLKDMKGDWEPGSP